MKWEKEKKEKETGRENARLSEKPSRLEHESGEANKETKTNGREWVVRGDVRMRRRGQKEGQGSGRLAEVCSAEGFPHSVRNARLYTTISIEQWTPHLAITHCWCVCQTRQKWEKRLDELTA